MKDVRIYTTPWCGFCIRAKRLLEKHGVDFHEIDVDGDWDTRQWIAEQSGYFERKLHQLHSQHEQLEKVKLVLFGASFLGALALLFFSKGIARFDFSGVDGKTLLVFAMGLLPLWLAIWEIYQNKMATRELHWQYSNQRKFFRLAEARLAHAIDDGVRAEVTANLAERSLLETFQWTIHRFHREHEPPAAG